jgi:hypothetical protein
MSAAEIRRIEVVKKQKQATNGMEPQMGQITTIILENYYQESNLLQDSKDRSRVPSYRKPKGANMRRLETKARTGSRIERDG